MGDFFKMDPVSSESPIDMSEKHIEELRLQATKVYLAACEALKDHSGSTGYQEKRQKFIDAEQEAFEATFNAGDRYGKLDRRLKSLKKEEAPEMPEGARSDIGIKTKAVASSKASPSTNECV